MSRTPPAAQKGPAAPVPAACWSSTVEPGEGGTRLDRWLAARLPELSRMRIKTLVEGGQVRVRGEAPKAARRLKAGELVEVSIPPPATEGVEAEPIPLAIVFEDDHVLVVDKPAGMLTHPGAGRSSGTLAAAALAHAPAIVSVGSPRRPGIVHRLDKGTSGLIVLAKSPRAYEALTSQLAGRTMSRRYLCLVHGRLDRESGTIDAPIGRDPRSRVRMAVAREGRGRRAVTRFRVLERVGRFTFLECRLETGRTHQIRVHLTSRGHPLVGDETYGGRRPAEVEAIPPDLLASLQGVALHAAGLAFTHPASGAPVELTSPLPERIGAILAHLRARPAGSAKA